MAAPLSTEELDAQPDAPALSLPAAIALPQWSTHETASIVLQMEDVTVPPMLVQADGEDARVSWIQSGAVVNLGDFPGLDKSAERAENELRTLEWVIEEQRRQAAGQSSQQTAAELLGPDHWLRNLLPSQWVATLKAHREWVAAGGTALLVIAWIAAAFSRRAGSVSPKPAATLPPPTPRRRRRRHSVQRIA